MMRRVVFAVVVACCVATIHSCEDAALDDAAGIGDGSHSLPERYGPPMPPSMERICWACASVITTLIWIIDPVTV